MTRTAIVDRDHERGSVTTELVIVTPLLLLLLLFVVALGRTAGSRIDINGAAGEAARAASIARTPLAAQDAAHQTASASLADQHVTCASLDVATDTSRFQPGGTVTVSVRCDVKLGDLTGLRLPSSKTLTATATAPIDRYRGITP
ncbi:MAG TPA: TadE/TadG family type IV pilus assembly protein [Acidimicrobiia bacterium]|jgi:Flp pilus assembly protein TadG